MASLFLSSALAKAEVSLRVVGVHDGDTIIVAYQGSEERVRLHGIDTPQRGQPFTNPAKAIQFRAWYRKEVRVEVKGWIGINADSRRDFSQTDSELRDREGRFVIQAE